ncbi:MAG TPA: FkbM family methyltransferase [Bryobacteraceae bacterium]|nr:FkbM family methyltransferase [Bryobacteraceae bacterium]
MKGAQIITSWHDYPGAILGRTESQLLNWFFQNVSFGETWLDVGAHYGYTAVALSRLVGPFGRVFAFEPVLSTAAHLERTRELNGLNQLTILPFALGGVPKMYTLTLPKVRGMADSTISLAGVTERILTLSLDVLWPLLSSSYSVIHGIKIDVQGMEFEVLQGMSQVLRCFAPKLVVEFHRGVDRDGILRYLHGIGYSIPCRALNGEISHALVDDNSYVFESEAVKCEF